MELLSGGGSPGRHLGEVREQVAADGDLAGLQRGHIGADLGIGRANGPGVQVVEDFGVGEDGRLGV